MGTICLLCSAHRSGRPTRVRHPPSLLGAAHRTAVRSGRSGARIPPPMLWPLPHAGVRGRRGSGLGRLRSPLSSSACCPRLLHSSRSRSTPTVGSGEWAKPPDVMTGRRTTWTRFCSPLLRRLLPSGSGAQSCTNSCSRDDCRRCGSGLAGESRPTPSTDSSRTSLQRAETWNGQCGRTDDAQGQRREQYLQGRPEPLARLCIPGPEGTRKTRPSAHLRQDPRRGRRHGPRAGAEAGRRPGPGRRKVHDVRRVDGPLADHRQTQRQGNDVRRIRGLRPQPHQAGARPSSPRPAPARAPRGLLHPPC